MSTLDVSDCPEAFATPAGGPGAPLAGLLATAYLDAIHSQVRTELQRTADTSACSFSATAGGISAAGNAWRPECGLVLEALKRRQIARAAAQLALALAATGNQVTFEAFLQCPTRLFIDGHLFEVAGRTQIKTERDAIVVTVDADRFALRFLFTGGKWRATAESALGPGMIFVPSLECRHPHSYIIVAPPHGFPDDDFWSICERYAALAPPDPADAGAAPTDLAGLAFVETFAPSYAKWNRPVSCGVLLQPRAAAGTAGSSSACSRPGLIYLSKGASAPLQGELLVHENAHQHLLIYELFVPLTHKGIPWEGYSPIKGQRRNARRTLLAAHAIGNMLLYYREASRHGADLAEDMPRIDRYLGWFNQMSMDLNDSPALTIAGRRLLSSLVSTVEKLMFQG